jgi:hypothetical protein
VGGVVRGAIGLAHYAQLAGRVGEVRGVADLPD